MFDHIRRIIIALAIFLVAGLFYRHWREGHGGYGLFDLLAGKTSAGQEKFSSPSSPKLTDSDVPGLAKLSEESAKLAAAVLPAVVSINTRTVGKVPVENVFGLPLYRYGVSPGLGSGVIVSKEGHVVTNLHVVKDAAQIKITTNDRKIHDAEIIGVDDQLDIAVLRISDGTSFPALAFASSDEVKVGQVVFAVGNPFGLTGTVTQGIISATQRRLSDSGNDLLQTDTVINPGNSGGPLVDIHGTIVGINVSIFTGDQNIHSWQGVGLAIPSNEVRAAFERIMHKGPSIVGFLGIDVSLVSLDRDGRVLGAQIDVVGVGSPAAKAGLRPGDVIVKFAGRSIESAKDVIEYIRMTKPGEKVNITFLRDGKFTEISAAIERRPAGL
ncbi:MAG: trypsin-like peptidase domain-containing protein [Verrucomicrobiaceae bacterium]